METAYDIEQIVRAFRLKRDLAKQQRVCAVCSSPAVSFDDELSAREYEITALCQTCQTAFSNAQEEETT